MGFGNLGRSVSIIGVGYTPQGDVLKTPEIKDFTEKELFAMASIEAMVDAGVEAKDIDAFYVGQVGAPIFGQMIGGAPQYADWIGMRNKSSMTHDEGCATTNTGLQLAVMAVASGAHDMVLSGGTGIQQSVYEKGHLPFERHKREDLWLQMNCNANDHAYLYPGVNNLVGLDAEAIAYAKKHNLKLQDVIRAMHDASITCKKHGVTNPKATFATETYEETAKALGFASVYDFLNSDEHNPRIAGVQRASHVSPVADGASALIVCATDIARKIHKKPIEVIGMGATSVGGHQFVDTPVPGHKIAIDQAYKMAGINDPYNEIEYMAIHDAAANNYFTLGEMAGYFKSGEGWKAVMEGETLYSGRKPMNTTGGRLACGHPLGGACGIEIAEAVYQMRGENGPRQMAKPPKTTLIEGLGGGGWTFNATILRSL